jgi:hypothetical protein
MDFVGEAWFWMDTAPALYTISIQEYFSDVLSDKCIGHSSPTLVALQEWPPRSPELLPCNNALWGIIKPNISQTY